MVRKKAVRILIVVILTSFLVCGLWYTFQMYMIWYGWGALHEPIMRELPVPPYPFGWTDFQSYTGVCNSYMGYSRVEARPTDIMDFYKQELTKDGWTLLKQAPWTEDTSDSVGLLVTKSQSYGPFKLRYRLVVEIEPLFTDEANVTLTISGQNECGLPENFLDLNGK